MPVDLNSILYDVEVYLGEVAASYVGDDAQAAFFREQVGWAPAAVQPHAD